MASIELRLLNFAVPDSVSIGTSGPFSDLPSVPLSDVGAQALDDLCEEFRKAVFSKAGKRDPRVTAR